MSLADAIIRHSLKLSEKFADDWQLWVGQELPEVRILQENGTNPSIEDFIGNDLELAPNVSLETEATYLVDIIQRDELKPLIKESIWFWISRDYGSTFEKFRALRIVDANEMQNVSWQIILGKVESSSFPGMI